MARSKKDQHLTMTEDDLRAARVLTLAVKFFGATGPLASSDIRLDLYPDLDDSSFSRQYLRDRELLATFGINISAVDDGAADTLWRVDEGSSYAQDDALSASDARMLYVMCHDLAFDPSFPYRYELRMALAKISQMYHGIAFPQVDTTSPTENKLLAVLVSCMCNHHGVSVGYIDSKGIASTRRLAILGSFGLREHSYFVASRISTGGELEEGSIRTYRLDRFTKAKELDNITYEVPEDFSILDYEHLPFQIGETQGTARFVVPETVGSHLAQAMARHGQCVEEEDRTVWEIPFAEVDLAAAWGIGERLQPVAPPELLAAYDAIVDTGACDVLDRSLEALADKKAQNAVRKRAGRKGSVATTRQLVALACSLTREGEVIKAEDIASTLGISYDDARHLIALVSLGSGESIAYLPVILSDDDDEVSLMEGARLSSRRIRLTKAETMALMAALAKLGIEADDPLVEALSRAYATPSALSDELSRSIDQTQSIAGADVLKQCHDAISTGCGLRFQYQPVTGEEPSMRDVVPQRVHHKDGNWYLDAYDLMRCGQRIFRVDRMSDVEKTAASEIPSSATATTDPTLVIVRFDDPRFLTLFPWDDLQVVATDGPTTTVRMPDYDGDWLARHLVACMPHVRVSSPELAKQMQAYAGDYLRLPRQVSM